MTSRRMPALLTTQSMRPKLSSAHWTIFAALAKSATLSQFIAATPPAFTMSSTTSCAGVRSPPLPSSPAPMSLTTTLAPWRAMSIAMARPMPRPAPVTITTLPSTMRACVISILQCFGSQPVRAGDGSPDYGPAVIHDRHAACRYRRTECDVIRVPPYLGAYRLTGVHRRRKTAFHAHEAARIVIAAGFQDGVARDAERAATMQDWHLESCASRVRGIGMQRVIIAGEAVDQRGLRERRKIADCVRRRIGYRRGHGDRSRWPAEAAVGAAERGRRERAEQYSARFVAHVALRHHQGAAVPAFVDDPGHPGVAHEGAFHRQRPVYRETLFPMYNVAASDAGLGMRVPGTGIAQDDRHGWERLQVLLVDELELLDIAGIGAEPDAERVEQGVAPGQRLLDLGNFPVDELVVIDRHERGGILIGSDGRKTGLPGGMRRPVVGI